MIKGGNVTLFVASMDAAVKFYTEVLGLHLSARYGNDWATVEAGPGLTIGLHPASPKAPAPGTKGAFMLGLEIDEPIAEAVKRLTGKGAVAKGEIERTAVGNFAHFEDGDGNVFYLWEAARSGSAAE